LEAIKLAAENEIILFCLPPHTSHVAQPLDVSFFGPLKKHWSRVCHEYMADNPGKVVTSFHSFSTRPGFCLYNRIQLYLVFGRLVFTHLIPLPSNHMIAAHHPIR